MSENKEIKKILISFSKDSDFVRKKIDKLSEKSGLSKSRIYEECLMFGFLCMTMTILNDINRKWAKGIAY